MRAGYLWLASFASCPLAGWPLLTHPAYRRFSLSCRFGLACGAGSVLISAWMTVFALAGFPWRPPMLIVFSLFTALLLRFLLQETPVSKLPGQATGLLEPFGPILMTLTVLGVFLAAVSSAATSPDLIVFWGPKAQAFAAARTFDAAFLRDPTLDYMHPSYPPLVTNLYAFASMMAGRFAWGAATLTLPLCLAVLAFSLPGVFRTVAAGRSPVAAAAFVVAALGFLGHNLYSAGNGDPWLWIYEILAMAVLVGTSGATPAGLLLAGLFLAGAISAKVEGLPFALATIAVFLILRPRQVRTLEAAAFLILPGALSLGAWFAFGATRGLFRGYEQYGSFLQIHPSELGRVLSALGSAFWSAGWVLPWLVPLAAVLATPKKTRLALLPAGVSLALAAFYVFTYLHERDARLLILWSAGRIFAPILAFLGIAALCRLGPNATRTG